MTDDDWLDIGSDAAPVEAKPLPVPAKATTLRHRYVEVRRKLSRMHRDYLNALVHAHFHFNNAQRIMTGLGYSHDKSTYTRWRQRKDLSRAIEIAQQYVDSTYGFTDKSILAQTKRLADHGLDVVPVVDKHGNPVLDPTTQKPLERMRDSKLALKATELLGKNRKLWGDEGDKTRVTVQIVDLSGNMAASAPVPLDGEFSTVEDEN